MQRNEKRIGEIIRRRRLHKGYTQDTLALELHVSPQAISKWETGQTMPDINLLLPLSRLLEISVDQLLGGDRRAEFEAEYRRATIFGHKIALLACADALNANPDDEIFLYRRACEEYDIGTEGDHPALHAERGSYLCWAEEHFSDLHKKYPENDDYIVFLAKTYYAKGKRGDAVEMAYNCRDAEKRSKLIDSFREGEDKIIHQQETILTGVKALYDILLEYNTRESLTAAYALLDDMLTDTTHDSLNMRIELHIKFAYLCLSEGDTEGFTTSLASAYDAAKAYDALPKDVTYNSPLYDRLSEVNRVRPGVFCLLDCFATDRELEHPAAKPIKKRIVDEVIGCSRLFRHEWLAYYQFCARYINRDNYRNFGLAWNMEDVGDAITEALQRPRYPDNTSEEVCLIEKQLVERLVGGGVMRGCTASYGNNIYGYCNYAQKEKYCHIGIPDEERAIPSAPEGSKIMSIVEIMVANNFKDCGIEEKLLDYALEEARVCGYTHVEIYPKEWMELDKEYYRSLLSLYERKGFRLIRETENESRSRRYQIWQKVL
ncbi:MAG: helix-turn-helix transcriptional regulator [Clostridia bacterium]|nr:helix-turn-helix transcriptional regulator [Clostridia bacterium]